MSWLAPLVFAKAEDVVGVVIGVIFVIIAMAGRLIVQWREMQQRKAGGQPQPGQPQPGQPRRAGGPQAPAPEQPVPQQPVPQRQVPQRQGPLEDEVGDFLRRAAQRRAGRQGRPAGQPGPPPPPEFSKPPVAEEPVEAEVAPRPMGQLRRTLDADKPRMPDKELGADVAQADQKMAGHMHEVFDHRLGDLGGTPAEAADAALAQEAQSPEDQITPLPSTAAAGLAALFADAQSIRKAILINEVLQRPEHRWS